MTIDPKKLDDSVSVTGQISPGQIDELVAAGFRSIIINRPDDEALDQPAADTVSKTAIDAGLEIKFIPMFPGRISAELIQDMTTALTELPTPVLAYCASGTRSTILWCCVNVNKIGVDAVLEAASRAGYQLDQIRPLLVQISEAGS